MAKLTTNKFNDVSQQWQDYTENHISESMAVRLRTFFATQRQVPGFYRHVITLDNGTQHTLECPALDIVGFMDVVTDQKKPIHILTHEELTGMMFFCIDNQNGATENMDAIIDEFYDKHPNLTYGNIINKTA